MFAQDEIRAMCDLIEDEGIRQRQTMAVEAWITNAPTSRGSRMQDCPGCGERSFNRRGRLCTACMRDLVQTAIATARAKGTDDGDAVGIPHASHHSKYPMLDISGSLDPEHVFYSGDGRNPERAYRCFENKLHEFLICCLRGFPGLSADQRAKALFAGITYDAQAKTAFAPAGFADAVRTLVFFMAWAVTMARHEGFEEGSNLLASMAAGKMTAEGFNDRVAELERRATDKIRHMEEKKVRH